MSPELDAQELVRHGVDRRDAAALAERLRACCQLPAPDRWRAIVENVLTPALPFELHRHLYRAVFADWDPAHGPPPAWQPSAALVESTNVHRLMADLGIASWEALHAWSVERRGEFWEQMIERLGIRFHAPFAQIVDPDSGVESPAWLVGARLNIVDSCFAAPPDALAVVSSREDGPLARMSYGELSELTGRVARSLSRVGVRPGDAIAVDMPMTPESVAVYLGIIRAGCVVVSIADSFAPHEIETRLQIASARAIFTQDVIRRAGKRLPLYERVLAAGAPPAVVLPCDQAVCVPLREGDLAWERFLSLTGVAASVSRAPHDAVNILFSSGTTGEPKAIPWTQTTPIKCAADAWLHHDVRPGDVLTWPTNLGWMMGPWLIFASLVNRAVLGLYDGVPTGRAFGRFVQDARVTMLGVVPSLVRAWRTTGCMEGLDWSSIRCFSSTGECSNADDMLYLMRLAGYKPVIEYCGGTEIGGGYLTGSMIQPASPATFSTPALGLDVRILDEAGEPSTSGEMFLVPPSIGLSGALLNQDHHEVYFAGVPRGPHGEVLRRHGDQMERLGGGCFRAHGRADDTMNLGGIKVSSSEIERVIMRVEGLYEVAAVAVPPPGGGPEQLVIFAVLREGVPATPESLQERMQREIGGQLNPLFRIHQVVLVPALPRTASNKVMRRALRSRYEQERRPGAREEGPGYG